MRRLPRSCASDFTALGWAPIHATTTTWPPPFVRNSARGRGPATRCPPTPDWDPAWDAALLMWMGLANLEERTAAFGLIDPAVLTVLREA